MATIEAKTLVQHGFPPEQGKLLADSLMDNSRVKWNDLVIDLRGLPASLLISAFFNGFLQEIYDKRADLLTDIKHVAWEVQFDFQKKNIDKWISEFKPVKTPA